jgi:hypothetical protein
MNAPNEPTAQDLFSTMSPSIGALAAALAKAQGELRHAQKDRENPHFKSRYADLASVIDAVREPLSKNGLSYTQLPSSSPDGVVLTTILLHTSGEWVTSHLTVPLTKRDAQGVGSALTYARRYALASMVGIAQEDDDGNAASKRNADDDAIDAVKRDIVAELVRRGVKTRPEQERAVRGAMKGDLPETIGEYRHVLATLKAQTTNEG